MNAQFLKSKDTAAGRYRGYTISKTSDGEFFSSLDPGSWYETKAKAQRSIDAYLKGRVNPGTGRPDILYKANDPKEASRVAADARMNGRKAIVFRSRGEILVSALQKNPAAGASEVFEEFHGFEPSEVVTVTKKVFHHEHLAAAGKLTHLEVDGIDGKRHKISRFGGAVLAFNEDKNQLFIEGGDQSVNLTDFGIKKPHELETLGRVTDIGYHTNKTHLGDEGGDAVYVHKFRSTNDNGRHVIIKVARDPDLVYDVRSEQLLFSGGSYEILAEGINK